MIIIKSARSASWPTFQTIWIAIVERGTFPKTKDRDWLIGGLSDVKFRKIYNNQYNGQENPELN